MIDLILIVFCIYLHSRSLKQEARLNELEFWTRRDLYNRRED